MELEKFEKKIKQGTNIELFWNDDENEYSFLFQYNEKLDSFVCEVSVYHASQDNNCENQEAHTEERDYFDTALDGLFKQLEEEFGDGFKREIGKL